MKNLLLTTALFSTLVMGLAIQPALAEKTVEQLPDMPAGHYQLDASHAAVLFKVNHLGFSIYVGRFNDISGEIMLNSTNPNESKGTFSVKTASIDTGNDVLEKKLMAEDALNAEKFPEITFETTELEMQTPTSGLMTGNLTMLGETNPVTFDVEFVGGGVHPFSKNDSMGFRAHTTIDRTDWGFNTWAPAVGESVDVEVHGEFNRLTSDSVHAK